MKTKRAAALILNVLLITLSFTGFGQKKDSGKTGYKIPSEYVDIIQLSPNKNCYVDVKGTNPLSVDVGGDKTAISLGIQENSSIVKLKAQKRNFAEANMIIVCKDTVLQFLIRYSEVPAKTYYAYNYEELRSKNKTEGTVQRPINDSENKSLTTINESSNGIKNKWRDSSATIDTRYGIEGRNQPLVKSDFTKKTENNNQQPQSNKPTNEKTVESKGEKGSGKYLREEVFEKLRAKPVNIMMGDIDGGIRIVLDRIYKDGSIYYYSLTVYNREKNEFNIDYAAFEVHRKSENQSTNTDLIELFQPPNNPTSVPAGSKTSMVFSTNQVEMLPEEFLLINISGSGKEIKIKLKQTDFARASDFKL